MPDIKIQIKGLNELKASFRRFPQISGKHINNAIKASLYEIEREAKPKTPVSEGRLRGSYRLKLRPLSGALIVGAKYASAVHEGTRPHWPPWGPGTAIDRWANKHGIPAFLVARKISIHGTKPKPFLVDGIKAANHQIDSKFTKALESIIRELAK